MKLTSSAFTHEGYIPRKYSCDGRNINPPLELSDVPLGAKSLVLVMNDPDVPKHIRKDGFWNHWLVFNIPVNTTHIEEGVEPAGTHGMGTGKNIKYYGPCPPEGEHRYFFTVYALDTLLSLPERSVWQDVEEAMQGHVLATAELMGRYGRN